MPITNNRLNTSGIKAYRLYDNHHETGHLQDLPHGKTVEERSMTRIYLIRHAEAEGNLYRRIHGQYDSLITENGYRQIKKLRERFEPIHIDAVYSSDMFRTITTARAIYEPKGLTLHTRKDLREVAMGVWEDHPFGEISRIDPERMKLFGRTSAQFSVEGGETFQQVRERVTAALLDIAAMHPNQTVAVFSHGTSIRTALAMFMGLTVEEGHKLGHSDNTAVSLLEIENGFVKVVFADDNSHLPEEISTLAQQNWWKGKGALDLNLWYRPLDLSNEEDRDAYGQARAEAWQTIHGTLDRFDAASFLADAKACQETAPQNLVFSMVDDHPVGILQMDSGREEDAGHISFFYMNPQTRHQGLGVQMLGQAVSIARPMGLKRLQLLCAVNNKTALRFYGRYGFQKTGAVPGAFGTLCRMEKNIGY